ncbi:MAG: hypothetical protein AB8C13_03555 [Phycisphaerales bacterium]
MPNGIATNFEHTRLPAIVTISISMLLHILAVLIMVHWIGSNSKSVGPESAVQHQPPLMVPEEEQLKLGLTESQSASIDWLGINQPDEVQGEAEISETNQAAQTLAAGNSDQSIPEQQPDQQPERITPDPAGELPDTSVPETKTQPQPQPEAQSEPEPQQVPEPQIEQPIDTDQQARQDIQADIPIPSELQTQPSPDGLLPKHAESIQDTTPIAEKRSSSAQPEPVTQEQTQPSTAAQKQQEPADSKTDSKTESTPSQQKAIKTIGNQGILSDREVAATRIKNALDYDPRKPNIPVAGKGLEIKTVRPRYTTAVRLSALPKNPVVLIYFNAQGKVVKAEFLRERSVVYSTGIRGVDEPLLSAIYQWRAKGSEIDQLDPGDPKSLVEVSIKIVFRPERNSAP